MHHVPRISETELLFNTLNILINIWFGQEYTFFSLFRVTWTQNLGQEMAKGWGNKETYWRSKKLKPPPPPPPPSSSLSQVSHQSLKEKAYAKVGGEVSLVTLLCYQERWGILTNQTLENPSRNNKRNCSSHCLNLVIDGSLMMKIRPRNGMPISKHKILKLLFSFKSNFYRMIYAHLQLLIQNIEGKIMQIKSPILLPVAIFNLQAISHKGAELFSPQRILDLHQGYVELSQHSASILMQIQLLLQ